MSDANQTWYQWQGEELLIKHKLETRASHNMLIAPHLGYLKVSNTAQPLDGRANIHLIEFLASMSGASKGEHNNRKKEKQ